MVDTGAVIITGETSRRENAKAVMEALAELAGDFVVAREIKGCKNFTLVHTMLKSLSHTNFFFLISLFPYHARISVILHFQSTKSHPKLSHPCFSHDITFWNVFVNC